MSENKELTVKDVENAYNTILLATRAYRGTADEHDAITRSFNVIKPLVEEALRNRLAKVADEEPVAEVVTEAQVVNG